MRILKIFNSEPSMGVFEDASIPCTARFKNFIFTRWLPSAGICPFLGWICSKVALRFTIF